MSELNPKNPADWMRIVDNCGILPTAIPERIGVPYSTFRGWVTRRTNPRNMEKVVNIMNKLYNHPKMQRHPSFGWATPEQIKQLNEMGICPERDLIIKQIELQNKRKGKTK